MKTEAEPTTERDSSLGGFARGVGAGLAHSVVLGAAFGLTQAWWAGVLAVAPLVWAAAVCTRRRWTGLGAGVGSAAFWGWSHQWIWGVSAAGFPLLIAHQAAYAGLFVWLCARLRTRRGGWLLMAAGAGVLWAGIEALRGEVLWGGYAWFFVGHPWVEWTAGASAVGSVGGVYMVSLLVATASAALGLLAAGRMRWAAGGMVVVAAGAWLVLGWVGGGAVTKNEFVRIAAVQTNLPMDNKVRWGVDRRVADFVRFVERTREAAAAEPDVIVWPETMFPGQTLDPESLAAERRTGLAWNVTTRGWIPSTSIADELLQFQAELGAPMVVGATGYRGLTFEPDGEGVRRDWEGAYNAAMVVSGGAVSERWYAKLHLTPFGEVMPGISRFPSLERALLSLGAAGMSFDLDAGDEAVTLRVPTRRGEVAVGTPICFEATAAWVCRRLVERDDGARVLINLTNDGWFGDFDLGRRWHTMHARWRCVELGVPMVRAANTGASCAIDGRGRIAAELGPREAGVLVAEVALADEETRTVYRAGGWVTPWVLMLGALGLVLWALLGAAAGTNPGRSAGEVQSDGARDAEGGADA